MSFIVKGIDLPEGETIVICYANRYGEMETVYVDESDIIQISKSHGRLIDEREVKKAQFIINDQWGSYPVISLGNLNRVSTILEAEEIK